MLTRSGWFSVWVGAVLIAVGRVFGLVELYVLGAGAFALVVWALLWSLIRRGDLDIRRSVSSARVFAGDVSRVQVSLQNQGTSLPTPVLRITDGVAGTKGAELEVPPLSSGASTTVGYRLPTDRRGLVTVGPLDVHLIDPFALVHTERQAARVVEILVYPTVDQVPAPPRPPGEDVRRAERRPTVLGRSSDEFFSLRPYVIGDDLRRVHWASSARQDEMMIRQDEMPQQGRTTILLDARSGAADELAFEKMVSAAASLVLASRGRDDLVRLVSTDGTDTGFTTHSTRDPALDYLARVTQHSAGNDGGLTKAALLTGTRNVGSMVMLLGAGLSNESLMQGQGRQSSVAKVIFETANLPSVGGVGDIASTLMVIVPHDAPFAPAWVQALAVRSVGRR